MPAGVPNVTTEAMQKARKKKVTWSLSELDQELAWRRWFPKIEVDWATELTNEQAQPLYDACVAFMEDVVFITFPGRGRQRLVLRDAQKEVLWDWIKHRRNVCLKARQIGFSTLASAYVLWLTFGWPDRNVILLSKTEREAVKLLHKTKYAYKYMPEWARLRGPRLLDKTRLTMTWENDSIIQSLPSANDPARGESAFLVVVDEWAFLPNPDEAWASIEPITDMGGRVIGISTANGEGNFFHKLWIGSQVKNGQHSDFNGIFFPWWAVDKRDKAWFDDKVKNMQPWQRAQEYPDNPEEAFIGSGNPVFDLENLRRFKQEAAVGAFTITATSRSSVELSEGGPFTIYETPNDKDRWSYVVGADIAEGLAHGDATCAYVLCVQTGRIVAVWHGQIDPDIFGETVLPAIGWYYRHAVIAPEVNNHGLTTLTALKRAKYQRIYMRRTVTKRQDRPLESLGWLTTAPSKRVLTDELAAYLREVDNVPDMATVAELRTFVRNVNGKTGGSPHDDRVMALGITVQARKYAVVEKISSKDDASKIPGSMKWWLKQLDRPEKKGGRQRPDAFAS